MGVTVSSLMVSIGHGPKLWMELHSQQEYPHPNNGMPCQMLPNGRSFFLLVSLNGSLKARELTTCVEVSQESSPTLPKIPNLSSTLFHSTFTTPSDFPQSD